MRKFSILLLACGLAAPLAAQPQFAIPNVPSLAPPGSPMAPPAPAGTVADLDQRIAAVTQRAQEAQQTRERLRTEIGELGGRQDATRVDLHRRARALYRIRRAGMLPIAGGFESLLSHLARVERVERMVRSDVAALAFLRDRAGALEAEVATQQEVVTSSEAEVAALQQDKQRLQQHLQSQQLYAGIFDQRYAPPLPVAPGVQPPAWRRPQQPAWGGQPAYGQITVRGATPQPARPSGFAALQGRLTLPVSGGAVREATREDGQGLEFVSPGATVVAAADGRVEFAQRYGGYGTLVIIDHGNNYYTLYGGLGHTALVRGEWVGRGARVGSITGSPLFFSVRQGTRSLNARSWVGL